VDEDTDLNYRMHRDGVQLAYVPEAVVHHSPVTLRMNCAALFYMELASG
jgi:GT2 family glycosyltransferase